MLRWSFEPILESYGLVLLMSGMLAVLLIWLRPWSGKSNRSRQVTLLVLRSLVILMLTLAMLRPAYVSTDSRPQSATLVVLFDQSRSMNVQDSAAGRSRWHQLGEVLASSRRELSDLDELFEIRAYGFADALSNDSFDEGRIQIPVRAGGDQTDIALALNQSLRRESGKRLAGVLLLTDGAQRVVQPKYDLQQIVRELARRSIPLYTVPFGKPRDQSQARDIMIERLQDQYTVFVNNELVIRGGLRVQGFLNRPLPIKVTIEGPDGSTVKTLGPIEVTATEDDQLVDFEFNYSPDEPGSYTLSVEAEPQDGELVTANNQMTAYLNVLEGGLRVLYLEGNLLSPEMQILIRSLGASPDIELDFQPIDPARRETWPIDLAPIFGQNPYDVVLIGDVDATAIGPAGIRRIVDLVRRGKGLMMIGGINTFGPGGYANTELAEVLPVNMGPFERQQLDPDEPIRPDVHIPGPFQMLPSRPHFITHLADGDENLRLWRKLPPLLGANRFVSLKPGQQSIRLAESENGDPLLLARQYGAGRVLLFAVDSTHRWWRYGFDTAHRRFWRQAMLWLANKDDLLRRDVWVRLPRRRFRPGEPITLVAGARAENGDAITDAVLTGNVRFGDGEPQDISLTQSDENWVAELGPFDAPGEYVVEIQATVAAENVGTATAKFTVQSLDLELADPAGNPQQLSMLSGMTREAGGRTVQPEQLRGLLRDILDQPPQMEMDIETKWRFGDSVAETWPFFLLFVGVLGTEWYLRKKWGLN